VTLKSAIVSKLNFNGIVMCRLVEKTTKQQ